MKKTHIIKNTQAQLKLSKLSPISHAVSLINLTHITNITLLSSVIGISSLVLSTQALAQSSHNNYNANSNNSGYLQSDLAQNEQLYKEVQAAQMGFVLHSQEPKQVMKIADNNNINNSSNNNTIIQMGPRPDAVYSNNNVNANNTNTNNKNTINTINNIHEVDVHNVVIATSTNQNGNVDNDEQMKQENAFKQGLRHESSPTMEPTYHLAIQKRDTEPYVNAQVPYTDLAPKYWGNNNQNYNANAATEKQIFADDKNGDSNGIHTHVSRQDVATVNVPDNSLDPSNAATSQRFNFSHTVNYPLQQPKRPHFQELLSQNPNSFYVLNMSLVKRDDVKDVTQVLLTSQDYVHNNETYNFKYHTNQIYTNSFYCNEINDETNRPTRYVPSVSETNFRPYLNVAITPHLNNQKEPNHMEVQVGGELIDRLAPVKTSIMCDGKNYKAVVGTPYTLGIQNQVDVKTQVGVHQAVQLSNHYYLVYWLEPISSLTTAQTN